jgi:cation diffusion facilitator family transporter
MELDKESQLSEPLKIIDSGNGEKAKSVAWERYDKTYNAALGQLYCVAGVSIFFIAAQCVGGYLANSIAIFTDTAHLGSDMIGFGMSILSLRVGRQSAGGKHTYGWARAEIMGTLMSISFLLAITIWLCFEATKRVRNP